MRASEVVRDQTFDDDIAALEMEYPEIDAAVRAWAEDVESIHQAPDIPINPGSSTYTVRMDYWPLGEDGRGRFLITYHATDPRPSMRTPYRTITLLTIRERGSGLAL